jgi:hypothetical protein
LWCRFDRLLLICKGESVFYGPARQVHPYFKSIGRPIPEQYNPADYLIGASASQPHVCRMSWLYSLPFPVLIALEHVGWLQEDATS